MIKLYLFERNVFTAIFFTLLSQQVIRNYISEMEKNTNMRFFMQVYVGKLDIQTENIWDPRDHRIISNLAH